MHFIGLVVIGLIVIIGMKGGKTYDNKVLIEQLKKLPELKISSV